jgi:hypothetical protein
LSPAAAVEAVVREEERGRTVGTWFGQTGMSGDLPNLQMLTEKEEEESTELHLSLKLMLVLLSELQKPAPDYQAISFFVAGHTGAIILFNLQPKVK